MDNRSKVECVLCQKCEETKVTGALSTKDEVTAHQNCLLFSSGLVCSSSPQFDDLFGFSVGDVRAEVKRGSKLMCSRCQLRGATAGCEVRRCKKSYHYPCAVQHKANVVEDADEGKYVLYCSKHSEPTQNNKSSVNGRPSSVTGSQTVIKTINQSEAGPSKVGLMGISTVTVRPSNSKRRLSFPDKQEGIPSKRTPKVLTDDSSNSDEPDKDMASFGPIETDSFEAELIGNGGESPDASTSGPPAVNRTMAGPKDDEDTILLSDAESESLLLPASPSSRSVPTLYPSVILLGSEEEPARPSSEGSSPDLSSAGRPSPPRRVAVDATPPDTAGLPLASCASPALAPPSSPKPGVNSASFWKSCNAAGCTQGLFTGFLNDMNDICSRIQSDRASGEDYDHALTVMTVSGKLAELVAKQQEELQRKQTELQKATTAMKEVVSALKMGVGI